MAVKAQILDFTNVKEGGGAFNRAHKVPGDYAAKIAKVEEVKRKSGEHEGKPQWLWTIKVGAGTYPYYTQFEENVLWKLRGLAAAVGVRVPSKKVKLDPNKLVGKALGVSLDDHEYEDKMYSEIIAVFPTSELAEGEPDEDEEEDEDEDEDENDEEEDTEADEDDEDDEDEDEDEEEPPPPPKKAKGKKKAKKTKVDEDELEELDIEDI